MKHKNTDIVIYKPKGKAPALEVQLKEDTVWLSQNQFCSLFQRDKRTISEHINNIFREKELSKGSTIRKFRTVQLEGKREVERNIDHYNLDVIISVGYRIKSKVGTQFRIWATNVLKEHLIKGYTINEKRLKHSQQNLADLIKSVRLLQNAADVKQLSHDETQGLLAVLSDFAYGLNVLDDYDRNKLKIKGSRKKVLFRLDVNKVRNSVNTMKRKMKEPGLFGVEKDQSLDSSLKIIYQTVSGKDAYPSIEEKAAHLLYFLIKNHHFVDGNKRIAATLFAWFLKENGSLFRKDGLKRIADNALAAITLMVAASRPEDKEIMVKVIVNLINDKN